MRDKIDVAVLEARLKRFRECPDHEIANARSLLEIEMVEASGALIDLAKAAHAEKAANEAAEEWRYRSMSQLDDEERRLQRNTKATWMLAQDALHAAADRFDFTPAPSVGEEGDRG